MFFYLYFVLELLSIFLDAAIIPTDSTVYPVSDAHPLWPESELTSLRFVSAVVRGDSSRLDLRDMLVPALERLCRVPVCRGRHANVALGQCDLELMSR